jgi:hypothetical protein
VVKKHGTPWWKSAKTENPEILGNPENSVFFGKIVYFLFDKIPDKCYHSDK